MNENILIKESCSRLRERGRHSLRGLWKSAFVLMLIYCILLVVPAFIINCICGYPKETVVFGNTDILEQSFLSGLYCFVIEGLFAVILAAVFLGIARDKQVKWNLLKGLGFPAKAFMLFVVVIVFTFLWSLLFIVPGIIAGIRYSQAFYIMTDDNSKSIMQCISESKEMMKGNKKKFFLMELSFAGWMLLSIAPAAIIAAIMEVYISEFWCNILFILLLFPIIWVIVYLKSTEANFYELLTEISNNSQQKVNKSCE